MLLDVKDLRVHYGKVEAIKGVTLGVDKGEIITLIGANGAGKSTLLRTISGLKRSTSGEILLQGQRIEHLSPSKVVGLGIAHCPEGKKLFPHMSVRQNLKLGAYLRKDRNDIRRDLEAIIGDFTPLQGRLNQTAGSLSGGEQQLLAMGRALMARPRLLLLDEPSLGLSPIMVMEIAKVIGSIRKQAGVSIILVEQNAHLALKIADRGYVLETGAICLEDRCLSLLGDEHVKKAYLGG
jgi:branched-chain amino acid transport system ATP-binding protein